MRSVSVTEAKADLDALIEAAAAGEEVVVETEGGPKVRLVLVPTPTQLKEPRKLGIFKDEIWISPDFDDPLPDDIIDTFYGITR